MLILTKSNRSRYNIYMNRRVLFVTPDYSFFTNPVSAALRQIGYSVSLFDYYKPNISSRILGTALNLGIIRSDKHKNSLTKQINHALIQKVKKLNPKYVLVIKGEILSPKSIELINSYGVTTINWYPDWLDSWKWIKLNAKAYTFFFTVCQKTYNKLKQHKLNPNTYYLPVASPAEVPLRTQNKKYSISFVGQHTPRREKYFSAIKHLGLKIWGYSKWKTSSIKEVAHKSVSQNKTRQIIKQSKIVVNMLAGSDKFQPDAVNVRTFETLGLGSFLLVQDHPLLHQYFDVGKELVTFSSPNDLMKKAEYYLFNEKEREKIAMHGYKRTIRDHTFKKRLQQLFKIVTQ